MSRLNSGARWHRWEPHIHAPGTIFNDQFGGADKFEEYLKALEASSPVIKALGVTDYYLTDSYEKVLTAKNAGRLPNCDLIFPNIELRLDIGTVRGRQVNIHLLISPDDPDHLTELKRFLSLLKFGAFQDSFNCTKDDLLRLGKRIDPTKSGIAALRLGAEQFKVNLHQLRTALGESKWARENILVAVAGSETDGTSGVREGADTILRQEIETFAHIIFASSVAQREFWLGMRGTSPEILKERYGGLKPCMHGSDAHQLETVGIPDGSRYSWIKGGLEFDALKQACIDPKGRAYVGTTVPMCAPPSQVISSITIQNARWAITSELDLNPGLVAIIGARGSGKTALADMIALASDAVHLPLNRASFLHRAGEYLTDSSISIRWQSGEETTRPLDGTGSEIGQYPRARYLSQQFVDDLCSAEGMSDRLLEEIERVIFEAHSISETDGASDFKELLELRALRFREARLREEATLLALSEEIGTELEKQKQIEPFKKQIEEKEKSVQGYIADRSKLVQKGSEARALRLAAVSTASEKIRSYLHFYSRQEQALLLLQDEVANHRTHQAPETLRRSQDKHKEIRLKPDEWASFLLDFKGDVDGAITTHLAAAKANASDWRGTPPPVNIDPEAPYITDDADLEKQSLSDLEAEIARLEKLVSGDKQTATKFATLTRSITLENSALEKIREKLTDALGASERAKSLVHERETAYTKVFEAIVSEQAVLEDLYKPLMAHLNNASATLKKLSFTVLRKVDVETWSNEGESLIDLRQKGTLKGRGTLRDLTNSLLRGAWESGDATAASAAMTEFRSKIQKDFLEQMTNADIATYRAWSKRFAKWLYSTEHISIEYSIDYGGVDIRKLSPGTRGIVLLLLYLALDTVDDRPLIIDQPEENLDPQSIFDELVDLFLTAKNKRQVIVVTHNANLVVNTDADQIIIAEAGPSQGRSLPPITYTSGGLENREIRRSVCAILEGGEPAFKERARRLRVKLDR